MTIGIGALCESGRCIVVAADTRATYPENVLPPHEHISKQTYLPFGFAGAVAGDASLCDDVVAELHARMEQLRDIKLKYHDHILQAIEATQEKIFMLLVNHTMKMNLCINLIEWKKLEARKPPRQVYVDGQKIIQAEKFPVSLIIAGFLDVRPVMITMRRKDRPESPRGYTSIGSGAKFSRAVLDNRGQHEHFGFARTLVNFHYALDAARNDKRVGKPADYAVFSPHGIVKRFPWEHPVFLRLVKDYANKDTAELDQDHTIGRTLKNLLLTDPPEPF